jgi:AraC-like DNA-binding protein
MTGPQAAPSAAAPAVPPEAWQGRASLVQGSAWFEGRIGDNRPHAHPALQLALGLDAPVQAQLCGGAPMEAAGLLIGSQVEHALLHGQGRVRLLYVERESATGRWLARACPLGHRVLDAPLCATLHSLWPNTTPAAPAPSLARLVEHLAGPAPAGLCLPDRSALARVRSLVEALPQRLDTNCDLHALAANAALSPSRFSHCFKADTGMAVRPYLRWLRLARALELAAAGLQLTAAAHAAGFADAAHLARTMRRHFGVALSDVLASLRESHSPAGQANSVHSFKP